MPHHIFLKSEQGYQRARARKRGVKLTEGVRRRTWSSACHVLSAEKPRGISVGWSLEQATQSSDRDIQHITHAEQCSGPTPTVRFRRRERELIIGSYRT